jgi:hypothetical protein
MRKPRSGSEEPGGQERSQSQNDGVSAGTMPVGIGSLKTHHPHLDYLIGGLQVSVDRLTTRANLRLTIALGDLLSLYRAGRTDYYRARALHEIGT